MNLSFAWFLNRNRRLLWFVACLRSQPHCRDISHEFPDLSLANTFPVLECCRRGATPCLELLLKTIQSVVPSERMLEVVHVINNTVDAISNNSLQMAIRNSDADALRLLLTLCPRIFS